MHGERSEGQGQPEDNGQDQDMVKGLEEDESDITNSVEKSDPDETDPTKPKRTRRQPKPMLIQRN